MRVAPVLPYLWEGGADLWVDAVLGTAMTHNDPAAIASSVAFVGMLAEFVTMDGPPPRAGGSALRRTRGPSKAMRPSMSRGEGR